MADFMINGVAGASRQLRLSSAATAAEADNLYYTQMALGTVTSSMTQVSVWLAGANYPMHRPLQCISSIIMVIK